jgi:hypothetical protein
LRRAAITLAAVAGASVLASAPAHAATATPAATSTNWAGYYAKADGTVVNATVSFTVPSVNCHNSRGTAPYNGSMWLGVGGTSNAVWLEQAGINVLCSSLNAKPQYQVFWELVPSKGQGSPCDAAYSGSFGNVHVKAGETVHVNIIPAAQSPKPGYWFFQVTTSADNNWTHYVKLPKGANPGQTAEVITEYPTAVNKACKAVPSGLVDLGTVQYKGADYDVAGQADPYSIAVDPIDLYHSGKLAMSPGKPYGPAGDDLTDSFSTSYAKNWWK